MRLPNTPSPLKVATLLLSFLFLSFPLKGQSALIINPDDPTAQPNYYDIIRQDNITVKANLDYIPNSTDTSSNDNDQHSNVIEFVVPATGSSPETKYRLADITALLPYTIDDGVGNVTMRRAAVPEDAMALLLAIYHFNNGMLRDVLGGNINFDEYYGGCNVRLTTTGTLHDTGFSPIESTRLLTTALYDDHTRFQPLPVAIVGAYRSACTSPTAILSGVNDICQVTYHSSSTDFDNKEQYPRLARTVPSSAGDAKAIVEYLSQLGVKHVGIIFVTDAFGSALQKSVQDAAGEHDPPIQTDSVSFSYGANGKLKSRKTAGEEDGSEIANAVRSLKDTDYRYFLAIVADEHYDDVMTEAALRGIAGDEYFWLFTSGMDRATWQMNSKYPVGSPLAEATNGIGIIQVEGGKSTSTIFADPMSRKAQKAAASAPAEDQTTAHSRFNQAWKDAIQNPTLMDYFRSKQPAGFQGVEFSSTPSQHSYFVYDAVAALGLSMCKAPPEKYFFRGESVFTNFSAGDTFEGASGIVDIDDHLGTRTYQSVVFTVWNARATTLEEYTADELGEVEEDYVGFNLVPTSHYATPNLEDVNEVDPKWHGNGNDFIYYGTETTHPSSLPPVDMNKNYIGGPGRIAGFALMGLVMFLAVFAILWTLWMRKTRVVRASQPIFLIMISLGCFVMATSIIPLSKEEPVVNCDAVNVYDGSVDEDCEGLDKACMSAPWLYVVGFVIAFAALFTKTWTINKVYHNPDMDCITVTSLGLFKTFIALLVMNVIVLISWTLMAPLEWDRVTKDSKDKFDRPTESYGKCSSESGLPFAVTTIVLNLAVLLFANWQAYQARDIQTEYQESRYIAISMASILQAWCMGIPIMIVVWEAPQAKFFVEAGIVFVTCTAVLLLIFIPKALAVRSDRKKEEEERRRRTVRNINSRAGVPYEDEDSDDEDGANGAARVGSGGRGSGNNTQQGEYGRTTVFQAQAQAQQRSEARSHVAEQSRDHTNTTASTGGTNDAPSAFTTDTATTVPNPTPDIAVEGAPDSYKSSVDDEAGASKAEQAVPDEEKAVTAENPNAAPEGDDAGESNEDNGENNNSGEGGRDGFTQEEEPEQVGIRVFHNPTAERKMTADIKSMLTQAQLENMRLQEENAAYEDELNNLKRNLERTSQGQQR